MWPFVSVEGFSPTKTNFPRFLLIGNRDAGDFQLQIRNISEKDHGEYECQVSPKAKNPLLRVSTRLIVLSKFILAPVWCKQLLPFHSVIVNMAKQIALTDCCEQKSWQLSQCHLVVTHGSQLLPK